MKLLKITAAIAATAAAATAQAQVVEAGNPLAGLNTETAPAAAVSAIAIVGNTDLIDGFRCMQGFPAVCDGNTNVLCAPTISSAELRALVTGQITNTGKVVGDGGDLGTCSGFSGKSGGISVDYAPSVSAALKSFGSTGSIGAFSCGQGDGLVAGAAASDAAVLTGVTANGANLGLVHATSLDNSVGFIKLDGVAPSALALMSSNYNLVANLSADPGLADSSANDVTVNTVAAAAGVASHGSVANPTACAPLNTGAEIDDSNGGSI